MRRIGVRELRSNVTSILKEVSALGEAIEITRHGQVVARLSPAAKPPVRETSPEIEDAWADLDRLSEEISARWPEGISASEAVARDRR